MLREQQGNWYTFQRWHSWKRKRGALLPSEWFYMLNEVNLSLGCISGEGEDRTILRPAWNALWRVQLDCITKTHVTDCHATWKYSSPPFMYQIQGSFSSGGDPPPDLLSLLKNHRRMFRLFSSTQGSYLLLLTLTPFEACIQQGA